jgi:hypothetical protein
VATLVHGETDRETRRNNEGKRAAKVTTCKNYL